MSEPLTPTIDQLRVFLAVVETGSLAAAGRKLNRATSAVSYAIDNLEATLGVAVFDRATTRKPQLSEAGRAVLAEARALSRGFDALRAKVKGLVDGLEAEVSLVVDVMLPTDDLVEVLQAFQQEFPTVRIRLYIESLGAVTERVLDGVATIGICGPLRLESDRLEYIPFRDLELVPVAAPTHPLASGADRGIGAARRHVQLVLTDRSTLTAGQDFGVFADQTWRLGDLGAKHALLRAGIGWGSMPLTMVQADLEAGRLVTLDLLDWKGGVFTMHLLHASRSPPGPAGRWLMQRILDLARPSPARSGP
ncbi:LysR family transcriptional regulator [Beijerinckiaceae bacterium RH AL1]|nr:LysR family transcriptional regulator [Beijerinckiaceae bacterium]VVB43483.1 LysR family transcriptional regulator [Beijerinckiaceae bacterium RH AL8]VVB43500.1 LysR family transcriptional regulator [Beijerinckiaceae bacterium RH CH11]VVC53865.1 LysR family transcriptional regulator [Beijerinckiaceae bacterium RH AL1]